MKSINYPKSETEYLTLKEEQMELLKKILKNYFTPYKNKNNISSKTSSYGWKHTFENICGFYISNIDFKEAMKQLGEYNYDIYNSINVYYNITKHQSDLLHSLGDFCKGNSVFYFYHYKPGSKHYEETIDAIKQIQKEVKLYWDNYLSEIDDEVIFNHINKKWMYNDKDFLDQYNI
jgi:hypothetical protein